jgi:methionyl-tRNA synthetase
MSIFHAAQSTGQYLFVPEMPTPNGRLHLGHMSGPYLRADILSRFLRSRGAEAYIVSGSDVYESHVDLKATQENETIAHVCDKYHHLIKGELDALDIQCDLFVNPLDPELSSAYLAMNRRTIDELRARGAAVRVAERVLYSATKQRHVAGCWMSGRCPSCGARAGSYLCEECGTQYDPQDVVDVTVPAGFGDAREVTVDTWFLQLRDAGALWRQIAKMGIEPDFVRIAEHYLAKHGGRIRLTNPGSWGMPYASPDQVIFTYTALFSFSVFCGELLAKRHGWELNPFALESSFTTIAGFGIDNAVPYLVGVLGSAIELGTVRPFDHYLTNHFYLLENAKFSTSRRHLVCASDLARAGASADAQRYFLAKVNPEKAKRNFSPADFVEAHNQGCRELGVQIERALHEVFGGAVGALPVALGNRLEALYRGQALGLGFPVPNLELAVSTVDAWQLAGVALGIGASASGAARSDERATRAYWWLKGLALLAGPFMPRVSAELWRRLGCAGDPRPLGFTATTLPVPDQAHWEPFGQVAAARIESAISRETRDSK